MKSMPEFNLIFCHVENGTPKDKLSERKNGGMGWMICMAPVILILGLIALPFIVPWPFHAVVNDWTWD